MHSFSDAVALGMVQCGVARCDGVPCAEVLEVFAGELASAVHDSVARSAIVCHILPHVLYNVLCVFCFEGEKPNKSTVMVHYSEHVAVSLYTSCHISEIYAYSFKWFIDWGQLLPLLL